MLTFLGGRRGAPARVEPNPMLFWGFSYSEWAEGRLTRLAAEGRRRRGPSGEPREAHTR